MSRGRHIEVDTGAVLEELERLYEAGETIDGGGVEMNRLAADLPNHRATVRSKLAGLEARGEVILCWGFTDDGPRQSFAPADAHPEVDA